MQTVRIRPVCNLQTGLARDGFGPVGLDQMPDGHAHPTAFKAS